MRVPPSTEHRSRRERRQSVRLVAIAAALFAWSACSETAPKSPEVSAAPVRPAAFERHGIPGPWWRERATPLDFDADLGTCRAESRDAREHATSETRKDVAYRAFLDCMTRLSWTRGEPPRSDS